MLALIRLLTRIAELIWFIPILIGRLLNVTGGIGIRLGPLRYLIYGAVGYVAFALALVYVVAPIRGITGSYTLSAKLRYDAERWLATAIYDGSGNFVGTFDPRLDSRRDVNYTDSPIEIEDYVANPDHKSIPVREVPDYYWRCLAFHEDRYIGTIWNPYGIDLAGVLKIPYSSLKRTIASRRPTLGVGGSTLPMQFARVIYKTPPHAGEGGLTKLRRKLQEWWLAPVIYHELTRGGDLTPLKHWAANHIWLAQRTGGAPLHGVEVTSRIVFGKEAKDLSAAEQFVLASAVNKPIILLQGSEKLNEVRIDRWRYIAEVRARTCAERLVAEPEEQKKILFELVQLASGPPDPRVKPRLQDALERYAPQQAKSAQANPAIRANALMPAARLGIREEMKQAFGIDWRSHVRGVTTTFDVVENLAFRERIRAELAKLEQAWSGRLTTGFTLDPAKVGEESGRKSPNVIVAVADAAGEIVRFYDSSAQSLYFGSAPARDAASGHYFPDRETRAIASTGKILAAVALANERRDSPESLYADPEAPERGQDSCTRGPARADGRRRAAAAFACSLNKPLEWRLAMLGQERIGRLVRDFGFTLPPSASAETATPPTTATVRGLIAGSPQRVHQMSGVVLAALLDKGQRTVKPPTLVRAYDFTSRDSALFFARDKSSDLVPGKLIRRDGTGLLKALLSAPLCHSSGGQPQGTLRGLAGWCAERRGDLRLHFAKTGTHTTSNPGETVDTWITGGIQFANGAAYSYIVVVGTGSTAEPFANNLHASQLGVPLALAMLEDIQAHAKRHPKPGLLPPKPPSTPIASAPAAGPSAAQSGVAVAAKGKPGQQKSSAQRFNAGEFMQQRQLHSN